jgi:crotonobetaine/carnitine-CoA ligase
MTTIAEVLRHAIARGGPDFDFIVHAVPAGIEDELKVTCTLVEGANLTEEELCIWSIKRLPYFAAPRFIEFLAALPKNPVGRIMKYESRYQGVTAHTWDRQKSGNVLEKR